MEWNGLLTKAARVCFRYLYVRLDGTMSIKKRAKVVETFNSPHVSLEDRFALKLGGGDEA